MLSTLECQFFKILIIIPETQELNFAFIANSIKQAYLLEVTGFNNKTRYRLAFHCLILDNLICCNQRLSHSMQNKASVPFPTL